MRHLNKILVSNLHEDVEEEDLQEMFGEFGNVLSIEISEDLDPVLETCSAIVTMEDEADAEEAIENIHGKRWMSLRLEVDLYEENKSGSSKKYEEEEDENPWSTFSNDAKKPDVKRPRGFRNS
jgi:RNA recognition motif-containing protein